VERSLLVTVRHWNSVDCSISSTAATSTGGWKKVASVVTFCTTFSQAWYCKYSPCDKGLDCEQSDTVVGMDLTQFVVLCRRPWNSTSHVTSTHLCTLLGMLHLNVQSCLCRMQERSGHRSHSSCWRGEHRYRVNMRKHFWKWQTNGSYCVLCRKSAWFQLNCLQRKSVLVYVAVCRCSPNVCVSLPTYFSTTTQRLTSCQCYMMLLVELEFIRWYACSSAGLLYAVFPVRMSVTYCSCTCDTEAVCFFSCVSFFIEVCTRWKLSHTDVPC